MEVGILGPLTVVRGGAPIDVRAPKQRAVLLRLVLDIGQVVSTDQLLEDVWAGQPPPQGLVTLRSYISHLRNALGDGAPPTPVLRSRAHGYVLELPSDSVDAFRFEQLARHGQETLAAGGVLEALTAFEAALALWRGPALLEVADENFARPHVVRLEELRLSVEEARFDALLRSGRYVEALPALEAFVARHPMRERGWMHLILAQYRSGRAPDALASHRSFRDLLAEELGMDPSPTFRRLAELILQQSPELDQPEPPPVVARPPAVMAHTRLVGRDAERERLIDALGCCFDGRGRMILISGPPGIGKTALLQDFAGNALPHGAQVHWGRCPEVAGTPAFWPWSQVVGSIAEEADDGRLATLLAGAGAGVAQFVPEVAERVAVDRSVPTDDPEVARFRQFEAVAVFLRQAAQAGPIVIMLDDLHWADAASLDLLTFLAPQLGSLPIVIAATFRDLAVEQRTDLTPLLAGVARVEAIEHLVLDGLTEAQVADLLADTSNGPVATDRARLLHERSDGNPFFVRQLARLLDGEGDGGAAATGELPAEIRHLLHRRLDRLPMTARRVLEAAAVLGRQFDLRHIAAMLHSVPGELLDPIDTAVEHGLVEQAGAAVTSQRFVHALVREVLYDRLPPARAAHLHAAASTTLERSRGTSPHELAEHYWRSAELFADDRPVRATLAAAHATIAVLAYEQAEQLMGRAVELVARHPEPPAGLELDVRLQRLSLANRALRWNDRTAVDEIATVQQLARRDGIGPNLVPLWWRARAFVAIRGDHEAAVTLSRLLAAESERGDDPLGRAAGHVGAAFSLSCLGDSASARTELALARPHLDALPDEQLAAFDLPLDVIALISEAIAQVHLGDEPAARRLAQQAVVVATECHTAFVQAYARLLAALTAALLDEPEEAHKQTEGVLALCEEHGFTMLARLAEPVHGWSSAQLTGDADAQIERMSDAVAWISSVGHQHLLPLLLGLVADVHRLAGRPSTARRHLEEAREVASMSGEQFCLRRLEGLTDAVVG